MLTLELARDARSLGTHNSALLLLFERTGPRWGASLGTSESYTKLISELVGFSQGDPGCAIHPSHHRGVVARTQREEDRAFMVVARRQAARLDFRYVRCIPPVVVGAQ